MKQFKQLSKRGLSLILAIVMCLGMLQLPTIAVDDEIAGSEMIDTQATALPFGEDMNVVEEPTAQEPSDIARAFIGAVNAIPSYDGTNGEAVNAAGAYAGELLDELTDEDFRNEEVQAAMSTLQASADSITGGVETLAFAPHSFYVRVQKCYLGQRGCVETSTAYVACKYAADHSSGNCFVNKSYFTPSKFGWSDSGWLGWCIDQGGTYMGQAVTNPKNAYTWQSYNDFQFTLANTKDGGTAWNTVYLVYSAPSYNYAINYDTQGGSAVASTTQTSENTSYTLSVTSAQPTRSNYVFKGWATYAGATTPNAASQYTLTSSNPTKTLYAVWEKNPEVEKVTLTYIDRNVEYTTDGPYDKGTDVAIKNCTNTRNGYTFAGWSTDPSATTVNYVPGDSLTLNGNTTLYAVWNQTGTPGITVTKTVVGNSEVKPGDTVTFRITVKNTGGVDLKNVLVMDVLPSGLTYKDGTSGATMVNGNPMWSANFTVGETKTYTVTATVNSDASGTLTNTAVAQTGTTSGTDTATVTVKDPGTVPPTTPESKDVPLSAYVYFLREENCKAPTKEDVPENYSFVYSYTDVTGTHTGTLTRAEATITEQESGTVLFWSRFATAKANVNLEQVSITFTQSNYLIGDNATEFIYTRTVAPNTSNRTDGTGAWSTNASSYASTAYIKNYYKQPIQPTPETITVTWKDGYTTTPIKTVKIEKGANYSGMYPAAPTREGYDFNGWGAPVTDGDGNITITALWKAKGTPVDPDPETKTADWSKLTIQKTADKTSAKAGEDITYTIKVTNNTGKDLTDVTVSEVLDSNVTLKGEAPAGYANGVWTIDTLANGAVATLTLTVTVNQGVVDTTISNTVTITDASMTGDEPEKLPKDDQPTAKVDVKVPKNEGPEGPEDPEPEKITVTWVDGLTKETIQGPTEIDKDAELPENPTAPVHNGYRFDGWTKTTDEKGNVTMTANYTAIGGGTPVYPDPQPPVVNDPEEVDVPEEDVPLADIPEEVVDVEDEEVPLAEFPTEDESLVDIADEDVPLAAVPQTGDSCDVWYVLALVSAIGLVIVTVLERKKREDA